MTCCSIAAFALSKRQRSICAQKLTSVAQCSMDVRTFGLCRDFPCVTKRRIMLMLAIVVQP
jgi:hypothetical protein